MPILTIARYTVKGYFKEKVPFIVFIFAFLLMSASYILSPLAVGAHDKIVVDLGLAALSIFGVLLIVLLCAGSFYREKGSGILTTLLSKPVSRVDYILGKYFGTCITVGSVIGMMSIVFLAFLGVSQTAITGNIFWAMYLTLLEVGVVASVMVFFSTFTSPILSAFFTVCVTVTGHLSKDLLAFAQQYGEGAFKHIAKMVFYIIPNLSLFNLRHEAVHSLPIQDGFLYSVTIYGIFYALFLLLLSACIFRTKDIT